MALAIVQHKSFRRVTVASLTNVSLTLTSAPTNGNLLYAVVGLVNSPSGGTGWFTVNSGWTQVDEQSDTTNNSDVVTFVKQAGASESATQSPCFNNTGFSFTSVFCEMYEVSGQVQGSGGLAALDAHVMTVSAAASPPTATISINPPNPNDLILAGGMVVTVAGGQALTVPSGYTQDDATGGSAADIAFNFHHKFNASSGSQSIIELASGDPDTEPMYGVAVAILAPTTQVFISQERTSMEIAAELAERQVALGLWASRFTPAYTPSIGKNPAAPLSLTFDRSSMQVAADLIAQRAFRFRPLDATFGIPFGKNPAPPVNQTIEQNTQLTAAALIERRSKQVPLAFAYTSFTSSAPGPLKFHPIYFPFGSPSPFSETDFLFGGGWTEQDFPLDP